MQLAEQVEKQVADHLKRTGPDYKRVVTELKRILGGFRETDEGRRLVYRIASRGDYQPNNEELKDPESIAKKILHRRHAQEAAGGKPSYGVSLVEDIVGIRIVCVYPSDVAALVREIRRLEVEEGERIKINAPFAKVRKASGYCGTHGVISLPGDFAELKCEVQILTLLEEAWSYKTHDLTYKGERASASDVLDAKLLSQTLATVDQQSERIKSEIGARLREEAAEHAALVRTHLVNIFNGDQEVVPKLRDKLRSGEPLVFNDMTAGPGMSLLRQFVCSWKADLLHVKTRVAAAHLIMESADEYNRHFDLFTRRAEFPLCLYLSRIVALAAFCLENPQAHRKACRYAERVLRHAQEHFKKKVPSAYVHVGWTYYCAGELENAIRFIETAVDEALRLNDADSLTSAENDFAYFTASLLAQDLGRMQGKMSRAERQHLAEQASLTITSAIQRVVAHKAKDPQEKKARRALLLQLRDTEGYLQIVTGRNIREVERGIAKCSAIVKEIRFFPAAMHSIVRHYSTNHVRKGWERLVELSRPHP